MTDLSFISTADGTEQHMLFCDSGSGIKKPLLVGLHTWSNTYLNDKSVDEYAAWCEDNDWALIFPDFRGANNRPDAMGSDLAVNDIADAVVFAKTLVNVDMKRIYLAGVSGGGHMALLCAARLPNIWAGVSAWVPIYDIAEWHRRCAESEKYRRYAEMIEKSAGGPPIHETTAAARFAHRSPSVHLCGPLPFMLDINGGLFDGREGSVPFSQSLYAFNAAAAPPDRIDGHEIERFYKTMTPPPHGVPEKEDKLYGEHPPVFRKTSGSARVTIFKGGHGMIFGAALCLLTAQRRGTPAVWDISPESANRASGYGTAGF